LVIFIGEGAVRLLVIDPAGNALDFAMRAQRAGHDVRLGIRQTEKTKHIGRGLVQVVEYDQWVRWADLVFMADNTRYTYDMDQRWRPQGARIVGASMDTAAWEIDRVRGMRVFEKAGVAAPAFREFSDYDKAIAYVKREDRRFVSKPCGTVEDKALSYCARSPEDMVYMLQRWKRMSKHKSPFILQEFISGIEIAVGAWFGPGGFNSGWCENFEFKKLMVGDMGPTTGEQGTVLRYVRSSKLGRKVLEPIREQLANARYVGYVDVNCIIDDAGQPWPLEFTTRPGWPTFNIQQSLHAGGDCVQWLLDLWNGKDAKIFDMDTVATGVVVSIPDYPYSHLTRKEVTGVPVYGIEDMTYIHPCEMMMGVAPQRAGNTIVDMPMLVTAGDYVLVATGIGETVRDASRAVYRTLEKLSIPNSPMYRTDIGKRLQKQLPQLHELGYAKGLEYSMEPLRLSA